MHCTNPSPLRGRQSVTEQELLDDFWKAFKDTDFAYTPGDGCLYRTEGGLGCAIGRLIPDADYKQELEGLAPDNLAELLPSLEDSEGMSFYSDMQSAHDVAARNLNDSFKGIVRSHFEERGLTMPWKN